MNVGGRPLWVLIYLFGNLCAGSLSIGLAMYAWRERPEPGAKPLCLFLIGAAIWCSTVLLHALSPSVALTRDWMRLMFVGIALVPIGWLGFTLEFTGRGHLFNRRTILLLAIHPAVITILVAVAPDVLFTISKAPGDPINGIDATWHTAFYIHTAYSYLHAVVNLVILLHYVMTTRSVYRNQGLVALGGLVVFYLGNIAYFIGLSPVDLAPMSLSVSGFAFAWAIFSYDLLDLTPIARRTAWDELGEAVVTLDDEDRVVDANEAALELFDIEDDPVGLPVAAFFDSLPDDLLQRYADTNDVETQIAAEIDGEQRHLSLSISPVDRHDGEPAGRVIVFQDITQLKRREEALRTREQELDLLRQVQSRVLRHNIRNELTTVRGNAEVVEAVVDEAYEPRVQDIIEASDDLLSISAKARVVEEIIDEDKALVEYDLRRCVEEAIATIEEEHPAAELSLDGPENCSVQAAPQLGVAIENILENAIVHNDSPTPRVAVVIDGSEHPQVSVADDGPGIPEQEVAVIEDGAETSLEHGSGIGLWVVKWVANRSDARLAFDTSEEGTTVSLRFGKPVSETDIDPAPPRLSA